MVDFNLIIKAQHSLGGLFHASPIPWTNQVDILQWKVRLQFQTGYDLTIKMSTKNITMWEQVNQNTMPLTIENRIKGWKNSEHTFLNYIIEIHMQCEWRSRHFWRNYYNTIYKWSRIKHHQVVTWSKIIFSISIATTENYSNKAIRNSKLQS